MGDAELLKPSANPLRRRRSQFYDPRTDALKQDSNAVTVRKIREMETGA